ncbi:MAG: hypothetical protein EPO19_00830 [Betaproteobacteria bacterium]|nr:MAG: hypothetical protein EPO19_00830 [Betaproteobacteria bacterium]
MRQFVEQVVESLSRGDAILFLGAGFSMQAKNALGKAIPNGDKLKRELFNAIGETPTDSDLENELTTIADYCLSDAKKSLATADHMRKLFTVQGLEDWQIELVTKYPWRRIYTTNYDNAVEFAFDSRNRPIASYSALEVYPANLPQNALCIHLNGIFTHAVKDHADATLRLSFGSYASNNLEGTRWGDLFERDVSFAGATAFIGYRLADLDVARLLVGDQTRNTVGFLNGTSIGSIASRRLENFGRVFAATGEMFTEALRKEFSTVGVNRSPKRPLRYFEHIVQPSIPAHANDQDRFALLMYGHLKTELVHGDLARRLPGDAYTIDRTDETDLLDAVKKGYDIAIVSRLGNGKTVALHRVGLKLLAAGWTVFQSKGDAAGTTSECSEISGYAGKVAVLFDGAIANEQAIKALGNQRSPDLRIIFTERSSKYDARVSDKWLEDCGITTIFEHRLDVLEQDDPDKFISVLDSAGLWGRRAGMDPLAKKTFITRECRSEISSILLHIVKSADISERVKQALTAEALSQNERTFLILATAISVTSGAINTSTLARLSSHTALNEFSRRRSDFRSHLYSIRGTTFALNSALFGSYFLRELVTASEVLGVVAAAIQRAMRAGIGFKPRRYDNEDSYFSHDFPSSLYVFRNLQLFVDTTKNADSVSWFFEEIRRGTNLEEDPLYWLQYAISRFFARDSERAMLYLQNAYGVARRTPGFLTFQIDNQYARYLVDSCAATGDPTEAYEAFVEAHRIIADQAVNESHRHYPFKVAQGYPDVLVFHKHQLSEGQVTFILNAMKLVLSRAKIASVPLDRRKTVEQCIRKLSRALRREGVADAEIDSL